MGFFKNIGKSIKGITKAVSIKNIVKVATGNGKEVLNDITGRVLAPHMSSEEVQVAQASPVYQTAGAFVQNQSADLSNKLVNAAARSSVAGDINGFMTKVWFKNLWINHKMKIIVTLLAIAGLITWLLMRKKPRGRR